MSDERHMKRALSLARRGEGNVEPNPMVGCVLVKGDRIIGEGYHRKFGGPHAEINALRDAQAAGRNPQGATAYVTLEPCSHTGKTGPCADALIAADINRVVIGTLDPHPISTGGAARLREAGGEVTVGLLEEEAKQLIAPFAKRVTTGLPFVIAKWAATIDGAIATHTGDSHWISNAQSRKHVHRTRGMVDAIMVGIGTVLADDPMLTARDVPIRRIARRVVIDPKLRISEQSQLVSTVGQFPLTIATNATDSPKARRLRQRGVDLLPIRGKVRKDGTLPMRGVLRALAKQRDVTNVLVEGGARLAGALHAQGLVDEYRIYTAARILGDGAGLPGFALPGPAGRIARMRHAKALDLVIWRRFGTDIFSTYRAASST